MRAYVKPELFYENFELAQNIATCGWDIGDFASHEACGAEGDSKYGFTGTIFADTTNGVCTVKPSDVESFCYEPGSGAMGLFNS